MDILRVIKPPSQAFEKQSSSVNFPMSHSHLSTEKTVQGHMQCQMTHFVVKLLLFLEARPK